MGETRSGMKMEFYEDSHKSSNAGATDLHSDDLVMVPLTPFPDRESPAISSPSGRSDGADERLGYHTPTGSTFNPFAPGPDELMLAPRKKMPKKTCPPIRRQLNFDSCCDSKEYFGNIQAERFPEAVEMPFLDTSVRERTSTPEGIAFSVVRSLQGDHQGAEGGERQSSSSDLGSVGRMVVSPPTPIPDRQEVEAISPADHTDEEDLEPHCQTPRESSFDPFAAVSDGLLMLAPRKISLRETCISVQRKLDFDSCCDSEANVVDRTPKNPSEEDVFLDAIYKSILDAIISCHIGECMGTSSSADSTSLHGGKTPTSADLQTPTSLPLLNGIADTCPGAPVRPTLRPRKFSNGICRKLEF